MGTKVNEELRVGEFTCDLQVLRRIMGLPETAVIHHIEMLPYAILGTQSVRIVVEDNESNLPPIVQGQEISRVTPGFQLRDKTFRLFQGWKIDAIGEAPTPLDGEKQTS